ncbi:MAG: CPBP family intramembrane metalloprotease [Pseudomonadaceae bacterium]|nr:CPBP family intramembrane metalloprotease [Pseudomonadaceae bacterium]
METTVTLREPSRLGLVGQIALVVCLIPVGLTLGALTGWLVLSPIMGMVVPLLAATWFLKRDGLGWRDVGFAKRMPLRRFLAFTLLATLLVYLVAVMVVGAILEAAGLSAQDTSGLQQLLEGNTLYFLMFLIPVSWGSAAFGEEMLVRGFLLNRLEGLSRSSVLAVIGQAAIFALAHTYQGVTGVLMIFVVGLIFGLVFIRCGRNLWPVIVAHGLVDTIAITSLYMGWGWV